MKSFETTPGWERAKTEHDLCVMLPDDVPLYFQRLPAGEFLMGSRGRYVDEEPVHRVRISQSFYLGTFPVTQHQWRAIVEHFTDSGLKANPSYYKGDLRPVETRYWNNCQSWLGLLKRTSFLTRAENVRGESVDLTGYQVDLPSEAQWEYGCRLMQGGDGNSLAVDTDYYTGDGVAALDAAGWYSRTSKVGSRTVGLKRPTDFGLYDLHGTVWEWCRDAWSGVSYRYRVDGVTDPCVSAADIGASEEAAGRVARGGSWFNSAVDCRAAFRSGGTGVPHPHVVGFRVCLFPSP